MKKKNALNEDYVISVLARIERDDDAPEKVDFVTRGSFVHRGSSYYITYQETEAIGYAGCVCTVKVSEDGSRVSLIRFGNPSSTLLVEKGRRNLCHYETPYGGLTLGVTADEIDSGLSDKGGRLQLSYLLDLNSTPMSRNSMDITVRHVN